MRVAVAVIVTLLVPAGLAAVALLASVVRLVLRAAAGRTRMPPDPARIGTGTP